MNKFYYLIILLFSFSSCSFDKSSGIWTGSEKISKKDNNNQNLEPIFKKENDLIKDKDLASNQILKFGNPILFSNWSQSYQNNFNNISNVSFLNVGNYKKYSKVSKAKVNNNILVYENNLFFSDQKGNIGVFSLKKNQLIFKYNFYKKKMKRTEKIIEIIIKNGSIIAADNFGYIYSIDYKKKKLNWAKNFLIPFRSNLKITGNILFLIDEKNKVVLIDIKNGKKINELYTQPSKTVSKFKSNLALDRNNNLLFLSTSGSLYSLNLINQKTINWIQNFKKESEIIFNANPIVVSDNDIMISTNNNISLVNINGQRLWNLNIKSNITPIISGNNIFTITRDNYLVLINKVTGKIIYSKNIHLIIEKDYKKNFKKKIKEINYIYLTGKKLLLISNNSYFIEINVDKFINVSSIKKNPFDISSDIILLKNEMVFIDSSKRIYKVN